MNDPHVIEVEGLSKLYHKKVILDNITLQINKGEIFGLLGPNGAGKSTFLEILSTLNSKTSGKVLIGGYDLDKDVAAIKKIIGIQLQSSNFYPSLNVLQILKLYKGLLQKNEDIATILHLVQLHDKKKYLYTQISGGERQKLALAIALLAKPKILFLDEPSTGLDPQARRQLWTIIKTIQKERVTIILSTHYMDEAEFLCDRIAIIDKGKIIAQGQPQYFIHQLRQHQSHSSHITLEDVFLSLTKV